MARGHHRLARRVKSMGDTGSAYTPVTGSAASPGGTPMMMPLARVITHAASSQYVTLGMEDLAPIWTTDGAPIAAAAGGGWGQLSPAGGSHPGKMRGVMSPIAGR